MSGLLYKSDWEETKQRYAAWWRREKLDRCLLYIAAIKDGLPDEPPPQRPPTPEQRWTDLDYVSAINDHWNRRAYFAAETFPMWSPGYPGHATIPTFYGCPWQASWDTGWHEPILTGERLDTSGVKLDRNGRWWQFGDESLRRARDESKGKCIPSMHAIFGCGDTLSMLRGTQRLLFDMMDDPVGVRETELRFMDDWFEVFEHQTGILQADGGDYTTWFAIWAPGKFYPMHCDVSYGISPEIFRECFVPALKKQAAYLDHTIYHLDGTGAFHLVEEVCRIDGIQAVQVLPGAGKDSPLKYLDVCKTVQRMGRNLQITISKDEIPLALAELSSRGLMINTDQVLSEKEARRVVEEAARLSVDRG